MDENIKSRIEFACPELYDTALLRRTNWTEKRYDKARKKAVELRALFDEAFAKPPEESTRTGQTVKNRVTKEENHMAYQQTQSKGTFSKGTSASVRTVKAEEFGNGVVTVTLRTKMALTKFFKPGPTSPLKVSGEYGRLNAKTGEVYTNSVDVKLWGEQATDFLEKGGGQPGAMVEYTATLRREKAYQKDPQAEERWETTLSDL